MNTVTDPIKADTLAFADLPALGAELDSGRFCGITTLKDGTHSAVILLPAKAGKRLAWSDAMAWAQEAGGQLPSRPVAALLYANAKDQLEQGWHWTSDELHTDTGDQDDVSSAWHCHFYYGYQHDNHKSYEGGAVAVRLIPLTA